MPRLPPDATWTKTLGIPSFLVPYGAPEQANHSPNESYRIERLWQGIATSATLRAELAMAERPREVTATS